MVGTKQSQRKTETAVSALDVLDPYVGPAATLVTYSPPLSFLKIIELWLMAKFYLDALSRSIARCRIGIYSISMLGGSHNDDDGVRFR